MASDEYRNTELKILAFSLGFSVYGLANISIACFIMWSLKL